MVAEIDPTGRRQRNVSPARKQLVLESAKIAAENGRARLLKNAQEQIK
jgi:hypothetical protein